MKFPITQLDFDKDFPSFVDLSMAIYGDKAVTDIELYKWLFAENIFNPQGNHFFHVAKDGDKVIASDCLLPIPLVIHGQDYMAAWSIKTMTHPDYQRQGIFRAMTEHNIAKAKELGIDIILGFANANSFPGYEKFGWDVLVERKAVIRPLDIRRTLAKRRFIKPFAGLGNSMFRFVDSRRLAAMRRETQGYVTEISRSMPDAIDQIWPGMISAFPVMVKRNKEYLNWRLNRRPRHDYHFVLASFQDNPESMLIFRLNPSNGSCIIIDYVGPHQEKALSAVLLASIEHCLTKNIRYIFNSSGSRFDDILINNGFKSLPTQLTNNMFIARRLNDSIDLEMLRNEKNWFYSYSDSELDIDLQPN